MLTFYVRICTAFKQLFHDIIVGMLSCKHNRR